MTSYYHIIIIILMLSVVKYCCDNTIICAMLRNCCKPLLPAPSCQSGPGGGSTDWWRGKHQLVLIMMTHWWGLWMTMVSRAPIGSGKHHFGRLRWYISLTMVMKVSELWTGWCYLVQGFFLLVCPRPSSLSSQGNDKLGQITGAKMPPLPKNHSERPRRWCRGGL